MLQNSSTQSQQGILISMLFFSQLLPETQQFGICLLVVKQRIAQSLLRDILPFPTFGKRNLCFCRPQIRQTGIDV